MSNLNGLKTNLITAAQGQTIADKITELRDAFALNDLRSFERALPYINEYIAGVLEDSDSGILRPEAGFSAASSIPDCVIIDTWTIGTIFRKLQIEPVCYERYCGLYSKDKALYELEFDIWGKLFAASI
jgi:hypothetical protein